MEFSDMTEEIMTQTFSVFDTPCVPAEWKGQLGMVENETCTRTITRTGGKEPEEIFTAV